MNRDDSAIPGGGESSCALPTAVLYPFLPLLRGAVQTLGVDPGALVLPAASSVAGAAADGARFDAVVLIAGGAEPGASTLAARVAAARARLEPGGCLVVAAANALALGDLVGGRAGPALEGGAGGSRTTLAALEAMLDGLGLAHRAWWLSFPAVDAPTTLIARAALARPGGFDPGALATEAAALDPDRHAAPVSLRRAWAGVAEAGLLADLAPGFAVAASTAPLPDDPRLALHLGLRRRPGFERVVTFTQDGGAVRVERTPLRPDLPARVAGVANLFPAEPFVPGRTWQAYLEDLLARDGWRTDALAPWAATWRDAVSATFAEGRPLSPATPLPAPALDAIPKNLILADRPTFIDLEWDLGAPLDAGHLAVRALCNALGDAEICGRPDGPAPSLLDALRLLLPGLGLALDDDALAERLARESRFQSIVSGRETMRDRAWAGATILAPRRPHAPPAGEARAGTCEGGTREPGALAHLREETAVLHAALAMERAARAEVEAEGRRRTDRMIAYAADLDRERARLARALEAAQAARPEPRRGLRRLAPRWMGGGA